MAEPRWEHRVHKVLIAVEWTGLGIGIFVSFAELDNRALAFIAAGLGAVWVVGVTSIPLSVYSRMFVLDGLALAGVLLTVTSLVLTGGTSSPFLLLALTPVLRAGVYGGLRLGVTAGSLTGLLIVAVALASDQRITSSVALATLALVLGVTVAQIGRIVTDVQSAAARAEEESSASWARLEHLESANQLLSRLADVTSRSEVNPIEVGRTALEAITERFPNSAGSAALESENGPILVARYGSIPDPSFETDIPLTISEKRVGFIRLHTQSHLDDETVNGLRETVRPVALAFANALLLQDVTRNAVKEERTRLARELHDEIGPSLASLGLSLDMALIQGVDQREMNDHLHTLRERVSGLVDEVRSTVTDLRTGDPVSLMTRLTELKNGLTTDMDIHVAVDERRPVRPSLSENLYGIIGEAVRNAANHSDGDTVSIRGWVDFDRGRLVVSDDGVGFDLANTPEGHYGLVGMRERARDSGIRLDFSTSTGGTNVTIEWGST